MAGPIVRQGIVQLGIEYKNTSLPAAPIAAGLTRQQEAAAAALNESAKAAEAAAGSLEMQRRAEEAVEEIQQRAIESQKNSVQWKRYEERQARALASAVEIEANSKAKVAVVSDAAAAKAKALAVSNIKIAESYQKAAVGALTMVRGVALLAGSESESLAVAVKHIFFIQGLIDISKGAITVQKSLTAAYYAQAAAAEVAGAATTQAALATAAFNVAAKSGPLIILVAALYSAIKVYEHFAGAEERAIAAAEAQREINRQVAESQAARNEQTSIGIKAEFDRIDALDKLADKEKSLRKILDERANADATADADEKFSKLFNTPAEMRVETLAEAIALFERQKQAAEQLRDVEKQQADEARKRNDDKIELIKLQEREHRQAQDALKAERDKQQAIRASIGLLTQGEQRRLDRAISAVEGGSTRRSDLQTIQRFGGAEGQRLVAHVVAPLGKVIADHLERAAAKITGQSPLRDAEAEERRRQAALNQTTSGRSADDAVKELQAQNDAVTKEATKFAENISNLLVGLANRLEGLEKEQSRQRQAARSGRGK